jgi:hypothetical protein
MEDIITRTTPNLPFSDYLKLAGLHKSGLYKMIGHTPAHYRYGEDHPIEEDTPAKALGRAVHIAALEPELFATAYVRVPDPPPIPAKPELRKWNRTYKEHKSAWANFCAANAGREYLEPDQWQQVTDIVAAINTHPMASDLIHAADEKELTMQWGDSVGGFGPSPAVVMQLKGRLDAYNTHGVIIDLKTTVDASPTMFPKQSYKLGYSFQAALYVDGCRACGMAADQFVIIAVETAPPYCVATYEVGQEWVELGRQQYKAVLQQVKHWQEAGRWPGYSEGLMDLILPSWAGAELASRIDG